LTTPAEESDFDRVLADPTLTLNPCRLGFVPKLLWPDQEITFGALVRSFFQRRNVSVGRFSHKLFNALRISSECPGLRRHVGVEWVSPRVFRVDKGSFARLLHIKVVDGALFHRQGNFPSHGFVEVARSDVPVEVLRDGHPDKVKFLTHGEGLFTKDTEGDAIDECRWFDLRSEKRGETGDEGD
jgi:hypothetical protein